MVNKLGSPPHTWRILFSKVDEDSAIRITSTHVENTIIAFRYVSIVWDHLHTRGEYLASKFIKLLEMGSPPHTWRILFSKVDEDSAIRITSTHVENTQPHSSYRQ